MRQLSNREVRDLSDMLLHQQILYQRLVQRRAYTAAELFRRAQAQEQLTRHESNQITAQFMAMIKFDKEQVSSLTAYQTREALRAQGFIDFAPEVPAEEIVKDAEAEHELRDMMQERIDKFLVQDMSSFAESRGISEEEARRMAAANASQWAGKYYQRHMNLARSFAREHEMKGRHSRGKVQQWEYLRVIRAEGYCPFCLLISDNTYYSGDLLPVHPHCRCTVALKGPVKSARQINGPNLDDRIGELAKKYAVRIIKDPEFGPQMIPVVLKSEVKNAEWENEQERRSRE